jgi:RNA polymerase sigma-70 factor, ECF subfamily
MRTWRLDQAAVERLHRQAGAGRWRLPMASLAAALEESARRQFGDDPPDSRQLDRYLASLHLEDLALACACAEGLEPAWEHFMREFRPALYRAADAIAPGGDARDLADSLYAELYGLAARDGERRSHFRYFHGRSSLTTWLRAVLAQRHVDRLRTSRRLDPLPADEAADAIPAAVRHAHPKWAHYVTIMRHALSAAVAQLVPRDRLRLNCYYAQDLTLAQIGQLLGEHEATVSRNLARTRRALREHVEATLREREAMSDAEMSECFAAVSEDAGSLDLTELLVSEPRKKVGQDRSN